MRLGLNLGYAGTRVDLPMALVKEADRLGYHSVWAAEAYGSDAVTVATWCAANTSSINVGTAIMQIPARSPALTAMTAATLSDLSGGRFLLGLGVSGPQVVEGWHGRPYGKPLGKTREYVSIVRRMLARERVEHDGEYYNLPYTGSGATGLGKPLRLTIHPQHPIPIYLASIGPRNVALTAEIADGWLPIFYSPTRTPDLVREHLEAGFARSGEIDKADRFDYAPAVAAVLTDDPEQARWGVKPALALYIGGMGAKGHNFYYDLTCRYGFEEAAETIQALYLDGRKVEAVGAVPDELVDDVSLIGPRAALVDKVAVWEESGVTTLIVQAGDIDTMRVLAELVL